jgi:glycosyltransferase involved in cell wall biosynthesis
MKKVLLVAYHYPPVGGSGALRTLKFTKYLPKFGFKPYILTVKNSMYIQKDPSLIKEIPPEARIIATFSFEHRILRASKLLNIDPEWFFITDVNLGWLPFAVLSGTKVIRKENIDVIYVTAPIWTSLLIGYLLKKRTGKPLVVDFRDPWTINPFKKTLTKVHSRIENFLERRVLASADYVVTVSQPYRRKLIEKYPFLKNKFEIIMNGFDPADFKNLKRHPLQGKKLTIVHTGSFYSLRTPNSFLFALKKLVQEKPYLREQIEVKFVGNSGKVAPVVVDKLGLKDMVHFIGYIPHERCIELMANSHVLLLIKASEGDKTSGIVTGKIFEYLGSGRPVLALTPKESIVADIVQSANAGLVASDVEEIKNAIFEFYEQWTEGKLSASTDMAGIERYNRKVQTRELAEIFEKVTQYRS